MVMAYILILVLCGSALTRVSLANAVLLCLGVLVLNGVRRLLFNPLNKIPGPRLNAFSSIPFIRKRPEGKVFEYVYQMHRRYGPVVRVAPDFVIFSSPDAVRKILVEKDLPKSSKVAGIRADVHLPTLFSATDRTFHKQRRRLLSPAFSTRSIAKLEPLMASCVEALLAKLGSATAAKDTPTVNVYQLVQACAVDVIGETAFGGSFHLVETGDHPLPGKIFDELRRRVMCSTFPFLRPLLKQDPYAHDFTVGVIRKRRELNAQGERREDLLQILMDAREDETGKGLTEFEIYDQAMEFMIAGSDTNAFTVNMALILLLHNPEKLSTLIAELDAAFPERPTAPFVPPHETLKSLPYLNAVLNETLRRFPVALGGNLRQAETDVVIDGYFIPKGTFVSASILDVHHSKKLYGPDANEFVPERWLATGKPPKNAFYGFSAGSRNCIGATFAWMDMRMVLASILTNFELRAVADQDLDIVHFITPSLRTKRFDVELRTR